MHPRAQQLIETLGLAPHPEGGWYRQVFRSEEHVTRHRDNADRSALTTIYFLLVEGTYSAWHRVLSDEVWHFYEGDALELLSARGADLQSARTATRLDGDHRVHVMRAGEWQAVRPLGAYTLVGCTVGPGFDFEDFEMRPGQL